MNNKSDNNDNTPIACVCVNSPHHDAGSLPPACVIPHSLEALAEYFRSDKWLALRAKSFQRDPVCIICGEEPTIVHHRRWPDVLGEEPIADLTPLCRPCALRLYCSFGFCGECINLLVDGQTPSAQEAPRVQPETNESTFEFNSQRNKK